MFLADGCGHRHRVGLNIRTNYRAEPNDRTSFARRALAPSLSGLPPPDFAAPFSSFPSWSLAAGEIRDSQADLAASLPPSVHFIGRTGRPSAADRRTYRGVASFEPAANGRSEGGRDGLHDTLPLTATASAARPQPQVRHKFPLSTSARRRLPDLCIVGHGTQPPPGDFGGGRSAYYHYPDYARFLIHSSDFPGRAIRPLTRLYFARLQ